MTSGWWRYDPLRPRQPHAVLPRLRLPVPPVKKVVRTVQRIGVQVGQPGVAQYMARVTAGSDDRLVVFLDVPAYHELGAAGRLKITIEADE